jgi:hypothetical protein
MYAKSLVLSLARLLRFVLGTKNYLQTVLMCKDRETLLVLLFEFCFQLLVKDCVRVDTSL